LAFFNFLSPSGVLVNLEFSRPENWLVRLDAPGFRAAGPENRNMQISQDFHLPIATLTTGNENRLHTG
jgi:hypothetical protein